MKNNELFSINIVEDFFEQFDFIKNEFKKIKLYNSSELTELNYKKYNNDSIRKSFGNKEETWPGFRSEPLIEVSPFLHVLFLQTFDRKFKNFFHNKSVVCKTAIHLRLNADDSIDWIHKDEPYDYSLLVYLSETNLKSGTLIFDENKDLTNDVKFIQNRAIFFNSRYSHKANGNHGDDINNGRLTFNAFFKIV